MKIRVKNINKTFSLSNGVQLNVLDKINFDIREGDFVVILGESGCGKSTLLNIIAGLLPPSSGEVWVDGRSITDPDHSISMLFQQPSLLPWLNVEENIAFGCRLRGEIGDLRVRVDHFIKMVGLGGFEYFHPSELSTGLAYRTCLARALIGSPEVYLLDEPFGSLDTFSRARLQGEFLNIRRREGFTTVFVTHDIDEAILLGNKIVLLGGRPSSITASFDIDFSYPRILTDKSCNDVKEKILKAFRDTFKENGENE